MSTIQSVFSELGRLIDQVSKERSLDKKIVINSIVQGLLTAARKKYGTYRDIEAKYNEETGQLELYEFKEVVADDNFVDDQIEIKLSEALKLDPEARVKDQIGVALNADDLGRIDAYMARQIVLQHLRDAENEMIFNEFEKRKGEVVSGVVRRVDRGMVVVDLEKIEAYIPRKEQIYGEKYNPGDRIQGYILEVRQTTRGPQIIMSRGHANYLIKLFEKEVPEIYEGIVKIVSAAREPGHRAKIAVYSTDSAVHPVGACVGMKGSRVQNITQELKGERIDVITYDEDPVRFVCNALAPAKISKVLVDEENKAMEVVVADDQLSLAIGKKGQNVRLAVNLTEWDLNIISLTTLEEKKRQALFQLKLLPDMTDTMAENIYQFGGDSLSNLALSSIEKIQLIPGYEDKEKALTLLNSVKQLLTEYQKRGEELPQAPSLKKAKTPENVKSQADQQLKEELAQLEKSSSSDSSADKPADKPAETPPEAEQQKHHQKLNKQKKKHNKLQRKNQKLNKQKKKYKRRNPQSLNKQQNQKNNPQPNQRSKKKVRIINEGI